MQEKFRGLIARFANKVRVVDFIPTNFFGWDLCNKSVSIRLLTVIVCFSLCFVAVAYRLVIVASQDLKLARSYDKHNQFRKEIVDRNGNLLAVNLPAASLFANPQKMINIEESVNKLAKILPGVNKKKLLTELNTEKSFVWIKRDLTPKEQVEIFNLGIPGFDFEREQKRVYTFSNLLSHVIGYVGRDNEGLAGLEKTYDKFLTNSNTELNTDEQSKPLALSIDVRLQNILNEEIDKVINEFRAVGGVGVIADPNNGEILAMVSKPDFDPHHPSKAKPEQLFNRASLGIYEMGSVFKILTMAIGLDTGSTSIHDAYDISYMKVGKFQIKDYHPAKGWHTVPEIFLHSSNIGVSQIALEVGKPKFKEYIKQLGLMDQLKLELPERGTPLFPSDSRWNDLSTVTMSYGYSLSISPLHFVQAMIPAVNGGLAYPLTLVKRSDAKPVAATRVFKEATSKELNKLLRLVVKEGTGRKAEVKGYLIGGKTGTAEKQSGGKYNKNSRVSSFLGVFPASNPKYVIYITLDEPKGTKETFGFATAGWTAAPAVGRIVERMATLYGIPPLDEESEEIQNLLHVNYKIEDAI